MTAAQRLQTWLLVLICMGILCGCQTRGVTPPPAADFPTAITSWPLANDPVANWRASSEFTATFGTGQTMRTFRALLTIERRGEQLHFIALSPLGIPLFTASLLQGGELTVTQQVATNLEPERVLADLQFCLWPDAQLREAYQQPWTMAQDAAGRTLHRHGDIVATARWPEAVAHRPMREKAGYAVVLQHRLMNYEIRIKPLPASAPKQKPEADGRDRKET